MTMQDSEKEKLRQWVENWQRAGERLRQLRQEALREMDTTEALMNLAGAFESCRIHYSPASTSGLVAQQAWFKKLAARQANRD
jgi:hypothetical protein